MDAIKIVLAGQPNVGKSMLINAMSGSNRLKVGNFSGVTVEKTELCFEHHCHQFEMVDLPGTYSIRGFSQDEKVAHDYLQGEQYDVIINVLDSTHGLALLETTGYMSRVAFMLDGFFHKFGLHGKSFIPLVTGFGCTVPAYMSTRTLKSEKDRLITLFILGFMSCGAKLPVYVLFAGAFFGAEEAGNILFIIYIAGALLGLVMAKILRIFVFKGEDEPFVMEMPKYRLPSFSLIWHTVYSKAMGYLKKAGTFILVASMLIWFATAYPKQPLLSAAYEVKIAQASGDEVKIASLHNELKLAELEGSYLGQIGKFSEPFFAPLGFDWKMAVALETGLAAKEVVVSTLGVLYAVGDDVDEGNESLIAALQANVSFATAMAFIVFVMIYLPCFAASMVFAKEAGGYRYLFYLFVFTTVVAWVLSFITYRVLV